MNLPIKINFFIVILIILAGCSTQTDKMINFKLLPGKYIITTYENHHRLQVVINTKDSSHCVIQKQSNSGEGDIWNIIPVENNTYRIQSELNQKFLASVPASNSTGDFNLALCDKNDQDLQLWYIHQFKNDKYKIINTDTRYCISIEYLQADSSNLMLRLCQNNIREFWQITPLNDPQIHNELVVPLPHQ